MLLVIVAGTLWGTTGVVSQLVGQLAPTNSISLSFFRMLVAAPVLLLTGQLALGRRMWAVSRRDVAQMMALGVLTALDYFLYFAAIHEAGVAIATLLVVCVAPVLVTLASALLDRRRPGNLILFSVALAVVGTCLLVAGGENVGSQPVTLFGIALALLTTCGYAGIIVYGRHLSGRHHPLQVTGIGFAAGAVVLGLIAAQSGFYSVYPATAWALIVYIGVIPTALGYGLFLLGAALIPAPIAGVLVLLEPITATILAWILFGERLSPIGILGASLLLAVIYLLSTRGE
jgi:DME family drug/metabolite transporter